MRLRTIALLLLVASAGCFRSTAGTEVGFRINRLIGGDLVIDPGQTVVVLPLVHDWYLYDRKLQILEMKKVVNGEQLNNDLDFKTVDGNDIAVDMTIQWRIEPDKAPDLLRRVAPGMEEISSQIVRPLARSIPRDALNELSSEEFYDSPKRAAKEKIAHDRLDEALRPFGIECERVILGDYRFHDEYQKAIDAKKVADQMVNKNRSAAEATVREWERELEKTKGQVAQQIAAERGKAEQAHLEADAYYEARKLEADAIFAEMKAKAEGIRKKREAIAGAGGRTMVKLRIAEALKGKKIMLVPVGESNGLSLQRTDINQLLNTLGAESLAQAPAAAPSESAPQ